MVKLPELAEADGLLAPKLAENVALIAVAAIAVGRAARACFNAL